MYFDSRAQAGKMLASKLEDYNASNVTVIALNVGGVIVGAQIALKVHAALNMLLTKDITLPGENSPLATISSDNIFTYNKMFSVGEIEEMAGDYRSYIDQERRTALHELHSILGSAGEIHRELLKDHVIILVSDGFQNGFSLDIASDFLKPVKVKKIIVATPLATVQALDRMHLIADEIQCLDIVENFMGTDHYYEDNVIPGAQDLLKIIRNTPIHWQR